MVQTQPTAEEIAAWRALETDRAEAWANRLNAEIDETGTTPRAQIEQYEARFDMTRMSGPAYKVGDHAHVSGEATLAGVPVLDWRVGEDEVSVSWLHRMRLRAEPKGRWEVQPFDNGYDYI